MTFKVSFIKRKLNMGAEKLSAKVVSLLLSLLILTACPALGPECVEADDWGGTENITVKIDPKKQYNPAGISVQAGEKLTMQISGVVDLCPTKQQINDISPRTSTWQNTGTQVQKGDKMVVIISGSYSDRVGQQLDGRGLYMYISPVAPGGTQDSNTFNGDAVVPPATATTFFTELFNNGTAGEGGGYIGVAPVTGNIYLRYARSADQRGSEGKQWRGAYRWEDGRCEACLQMTINGVCAAVGAATLGIGYYPCMAAWEGGCAGTGHLQRAASDSHYEGGKCQEHWSEAGSVGGGYHGPDMTDHWVNEGYERNSATGYGIVISYGCPGVYGKYLKMNIGSSTVQMQDLAVKDCPLIQDPGLPECTLCPPGAKANAGKCYTIISNGVLGPVLKEPVFAAPSFGSCASCDLNSSGQNALGAPHPMPAPFLYRGYYGGKTESIVPSSGELWFEVLDTSTEKNVAYPNGAHFPDNIGSYTIKVATAKVQTGMADFLNSLVNPMRYLIFGYCRAADPTATYAEFIKYANQTECVSNTISVANVWHEGMVGETSYCEASDNPTTSSNEAQVARDTYTTRAACEASSTTVGYSASWKPGITQATYERLVESSIFINLVRALMILVLVVYGLMFMLGMIKQAQEVFISTVLRIAIIATLISPTSWYFFNNYLFTFFVDGMNSLIGILAGDFIGSGSINIKNPFSFINGTMTRFFNTNTMIKLIGLLFTSPIGFLYIAAMLAGIFFFLFAVLQAAILYILAMLSISLLLIVAPLFISLMLFKFTRGYFDKWILSLINYLFQPVLVITALSIFNVFVYSAIYALLHYKVCWDTIWSMTIPLGELGDLEIPIFNFYIAKGGLDGGSALASGAPIGFFMILIFIIITNAMLKFVKFMADLTSKITVASGSLASAAESTLASGVGLLKGAASLAVDGAKKIYDSTGEDKKKSGGDDKKDSGGGDKAGGDKKDAGGGDKTPRK